MYSIFVLVRCHSLWVEGAFVPKQQYVLFDAGLDPSRQLYSNHHLNDVLQRSLLRKVARTPSFFEQALT